MLPEKHAKPIGFRVFYCSADTYCFTSGRAALSFKPNNQIDPFSPRLSNFWVHSIRASNTSHQTLFFIQHPSPNGSIQTAVWVNSGYISRPPLRATDHLFSFCFPKPLTPCFDSQSPHSPHLTPSLEPSTPARKHSCIFPFAPSVRSTINTFSSRCSYYSSIFCFRPSIPL